MNENIDRLTGIIDSILGMFFGVYDDIARSISGNGEVFAYIGGFLFIAFLVAMAFRKIGEPS
ncbi:hypothetical protein ACK16A_11045 [Klebsiella michiganensis]|uniref:hypothetical protein n=1 Tax=Klebsiella michiganensis TaxID=1134687 RepID=UPI00397090B2